MASTKPLEAEKFRGYLIILARTSRFNWPGQHKIDASDVVQEVLIQAHRAFAQFRGKTEAELMAWLRVILANKLADAARHLGRQKRDAALEQSFRETLDESSKRLGRLVPADQTSPSQRVLQHERVLFLTEALAELPDDQRMAIELHHLVGCSVAEIAGQMQRTNASVAGLIRRGLAGLRAYLKNKNLEYIHFATRR